MCQVTQRVQEMSQKMSMITSTITGLVQSVNTIAQFMNINSQTLESPQSGQTPIQIIPNLSPTETSTHPHNHPSKDTLPPQEQPPYNQEVLIT